MARRTVRRRTVRRKSVRRPGARRSVRRSRKKRKSIGGAYVSTPGAHRDQYLQVAKEGGGNPLATPDETPDETHGAGRGWRDRGRDTRAKIARFSPTRIEVRRRKDIPTEPRRASHLLGKREPDQVFRNIRSMCVRSVMRLRVLIMHCIIENLYTYGYMRENCLSSKSRLMDLRLLTPGKRFRAGILGRHVFIGMLAEKHDIMVTGVEELQFYFEAIKRLDQILAELGVRVEENKTIAIQIYGDSAEDTLDPEHLRKLRETRPAMANDTESRDILKQKYKFYGNNRYFRLIVPSFKLPKTYRRTLYDMLIQLREFLLDPEARAHMEAVAQADSVGSDLQHAVAGNTDDQEQVVSEEAAEAAQDATGEISPDNAIKFEKLQQDVFRLVGNFKAEDFEPNIRAGAMSVTDDAAGDTAVSMGDFAAHGIGSHLESGLGGIAKTFVHKIGPAAAAVTMAPAALLSLGIVAFVHEKYKHTCENWIRSAEILLFSPIANISALQTERRDELDSMFDRTLPTSEEGGLESGMLSRQRSQDLARTVPTSEAGLEPQQAPLEPEPILDRRSEQYSGLSPVGADKTSGISGNSLQLSLPPLNQNSK